MKWKSWFFLLLFFPIIVFIFWIFSSSVFPKIISNESSTFDEAEPLALSEPLITFVDPSRGSDSPSITIVEYGNYSCPFCKQASKKITSILSAQDDVRFIWKDLPSSTHLGSKVAAEAAQCAKDQGRFWEFHDELFDQNDSFNHTSLTLTANELGLDIDRFGKCLSEGEKRYLIERSVSEAQALNIDGVPYFFLNGEQYSGPITYEALLEAIK